MKFLDCLGLSTCIWGLYFNAKAMTLLLGNASGYGDLIVFIVLALCGMLSLVGVIGYVADFIKEISNGAE